MDDTLVETVGLDGKKMSPKLALGLKNFIIDIDGVVSEDTPNEEPERMKTAYMIPGAKEQINEWYDEGHIITFFTSRSDDLKEITTNWLIAHGFKFHKLICGKPRGGNYHYIDDRQIRATRFKGRFTKLVTKSKEIEVFE